MIKVFNALDKDYTSNGDAVIIPLKARVKNSDNGDFYLEMTCGTEYNDYIQPNNILVAPTPQGEQAFRISSNITKTKKKITVKAWHIFYDSNNYLIADSYAVNMTCNDALNHFNSATDNPSPFTMYSDIISTNTFRCVRKSLAECINTVLERWGGHLRRDNWNISILASIGVDNGITIQYKKNLEELTATYDWSGVCTKVLPVGKDGILLDELYVYSSIQYDIPYTKTVSFSQDIDENDYKDDEGNVDEDAYKSALKSDLRKQAKEYVNKACYPSVNYTLKGKPEKVTEIGDIIRVQDKRIGVDITTSVISYEYDCLLKKYVSLEFGNFDKTLNNLVSNINNSTTSQVDTAVVALTSDFNSAISKAQTDILSRFTDSYCIYEGEQILIVDRLPSDKATNVIKINNAGVSLSKTGINGTFTTALNINGDFNAQALNFINLNTVKELFYQKGNKYSANKRIVNGYITNDSKQIYFTLTMPKSMANVTPTLTELKINGRHVGGGYIFSSAYISAGYDVLNDSALNVSIAKKTDDYITVLIESTTAWSVTDNTPVSISIESLKISFN